MSQIPQHFIQDLLNRVDIVDLIQPKVAIKKRGANYLGICPFHQEKSPSFTVSQAKQFYHCFGCGKHGNAIGFLMDFDRLDFVTAIEELARQQGLEIPREQGRSEKREDFQVLYTLTEKASDFYEMQLRTAAQRDKAVNYLKKRGLSGLTAKRFSLGFAPDGWDHLIKFLNPSREETQNLKQIGLLSENDKGRVFDKFRDRIMFPIRDKRGRVVAFGGRVIDQGEPKYLNSPETPLFHKGKMLYGIYEAKQKFTKFGQLLVVEGYMDVVMLAQHGIDYAVGALGTATTPDHIRLLKQECQEIIFCFDGDNAGREAAWRALKVALPFMTGELDLRFLFLPEGEDPDSLVQQIGKAEFEKRLRTDALSLAAVLLKKLDEGLNLKTLAGKSRWMLNFKPLYDLLPVGPYKTFRLDSIGRRFNFTYEQILELLEKNPQELGSAPEIEMHLNLEQKGLTLLLQHPQLANVNENLDLIEAFNKLALMIRANHLQNTGQIMEFLRESPEAEYYAKLAMHPYPSVISDVETEWHDILKKLSHTTESELEVLQDSAKTRSLTESEKDRLRLLIRGKL